MEIEQPNWLYCLCNELHDVDATTMLGKKHRTLSFFDSEARKNPQIVDASMRYATEEYLFIIFSSIGEFYSRIDSFRNVTDSDLTYMRLKYGLNRMYLIDEPNKSILVKEVARSAYNEMIENPPTDEDEVMELHGKNLQRLAMCEVT